VPGWRPASELLQLSVLLLLLLLQVLLHLEEALGLSCRIEGAPQCPELDEMGGQIS
jgi:hypothetical protein